jgi:hypothetical protein
MMMMMRMIIIYRWYATYSSQNDLMWMERNEGQNVKNETKEDL